MLNYSSLEFAYELQRKPLSYEEEPQRKDYSRNRANRPKRKNRRRAALGIAGRRSKRVYS